MSTRPVKQLTTTSYALLGLLSLRPWSAYELSKQMKRSLAFCWPRAERAIYDEPKTLVTQGLARATSEVNGRRRRTVYTITPKGGRALRLWLAQPSSPPEFESEAVVRTLFAESGSRSDLLATVRGLRAHALALRAQSDEVIRDYGEGRGPFPERLHIHALCGKFFVDYIRLLESWSEWAESEVERWPDTTSAAAFPRALEVLRSLASHRDGRPPARNQEGIGLPWV